MTKQIYLFSISSHPDAVSISSLDISFFQPSIDFSKYDYFILTSKQAVKALQQYQKEEYIDKQALCISAQTAKSYEELGGKILEVGTGYGDDLKNIIRKYPKKRRWLYLRAETIASDFVKVLEKEKYKIYESIVYKSECSKAIQNVQVQKNAILIFTSPSSIKCFLKRHTIYNNQEVIVIGKTTGKALPKQIKYKIAKEKTIQSCFKEIE